MVLSHSIVPFSALSHLSQPFLLLLLLLLLRHAGSFMSARWTLQDLLELTDSEIHARVSAKKPAAKLAKAVQHLQRSWLQVRADAKNYTA